MAWAPSCYCLRLLTVLVVLSKMVLLPASILVLLYTFRQENFVAAQTSSDNTYSLSNEITNIIPSCARTCFTSFIESNYPSTVCTTSPSLDCLCSKSSTSSYTVGEGALQCIISEDNAGFCHGTDATSDVAKNAYNMCIGRANALPNTHATITATLVIETQSSSPSLLPSVVVAATTPSDSSVPNSVISGSQPSNTSNPGTPTSSPSTILVAVTNTPTVIAVSQTVQPSSSTAPSNLTTPQITGIAVGCGVAGILAIGALVLWACIRRRRILRDDHDSDFGFEVEHGNSMEHMFRGGADKQFGNMGPGGTTSGVAARIPPRIPPRLDTDPNMFSRRSIPAAEIGLALSPDRNQVENGTLGQRHASKLLPEKPALPKLAVVIPSQPGSRPWRPPFAQDRSAIAMAENARDSVATQFEEDILSPETAASAKTGAHLDIGFAYTPQQVLPPQPVKWQMPEPPRSMTVPPQAVVRPLDIRKSQSHQSFSKPIQPHTGGSSVYSEADPTVPYVGIVDTPQSGRRDQYYRQYQSNPYQPHPYHHLNKPNQSDSGSITSIESAVQPEPRNTEPHVAELSPVVESPVGRSPVSYPRIPQRLSDQTNNGLHPLLQPNPDPAAAERWARNVPASTISTTNTMAIHNNIWSEQSPLSVRQESTSSSSSSLLAKRRGNKAAPSLSLVGQNAGVRGQPTWRIVNQGGNPERAELPPTPGWTPKLTPKKVGDEMFFDVR